MINASKKFKENLKKGANVVNYADFTLSDGTVLRLEPKDFMISGCSIEDKTTDGKFGVGFVVGKTCSLRIANHDERFSQYDFYNSIINLYVALALDNGIIEKIRKGVYYTLVPETPGDVIEISAVDGMYQLDRDYADSTTAYPATLQTIISQACTDCGIPIGFRQFDNMSFVVQTKPENITYRQVVSYVCQIAGYNARIDNDGYMQLVWYNTSMLDWYNYDGGDFKTYPHDTILDGGDFTNYGQGVRIDGGLFTDKIPEHIFRIKNLTVSTDDVQITGVKVVGGNDNAALFGEEGYIIEVNNPFVIGKENEVANYLGNRMVGMIFRPFNTDVLNNPLYEPFDVVRISDRKGNVYVSIINAVSYKIGGYTTVSCQAEDPVRNGTTYFSDAAQAVVEARRDTQKQITEYDKAVQNMNQLAANAMGLFREEELQSNGSYISYESDRPITVDENGKCHFEAGSHVWKKSDAGFFVSEDGGKTYTAGFDKNNNAVLNVLYAIGIVADWIRSGRFEVKKGNKTTFLADADTGEVRIVADEFSLSSGKTIESIAQDKSETALNIAKEYTDGEITSYSSTVNSSFKVVNDSIAAEVTRATRAEGVIDGNIKTVNETLSSKIDQTAEAITLNVSKIYETKTDAGTKYDTLSSSIKQTAESIKLKVTAGDVESLIDQNADSIRLKAGKIAWSSDNSTMTEDGVFSTTEAFGNTYKKTEIKEGVINGYIGTTKSGLLDLSAKYSDNKRHASLNGLDTLHLQSGSNISFEIVQINSIGEIEIVSNPISIQNGKVSISEAIEFKNNSSFNATANFERVANFKDTAYFESGVYLKNTVRFEKNLYSGGELGLSRNVIIPVNQSINRTMTFKNGILVNVQN